MHQPQGTGTGNGNSTGNGTEIAKKGWRSKHFRAFVLRLAILGIVGYFLFLTLRNAWRQVVGSGLELDWRAVDWWVFAWSIPCGMLALLPACFAWQRIVGDFGQNVSWPNSFYAYFLGHFGKYVPGKAMAVVLRVGELHRHGVAARPAVVSVFIETLTGIATGAILGACLIVVVNVPDWIKFAAWACIPFAILALMPHTFRWVVHRVAKSRIGKMPPRIAEAIDGRMMLRTVCAGFRIDVARGSSRKRGRFYMDPRDDRSSANRPFGNHSDADYFDHCRDEHDRDSEVYPMGEPNRTLLAWRMYCLDRSPSFIGTRQW